MFTKKGAIVCFPAEPPFRGSNISTTAFRQQLSIYDLVRFVDSRAAPRELKKIWYGMLFSGVTDFSFLRTRMNGSGVFEPDHRICRMPLVGMN